MAALRRLGVEPVDAGRLAERCLERGGLETDLVPLLVSQRAAIARQRDDLNCLEAELLDLELTITAAGRPGRKQRMTDPIRVLFVCTQNSARSQIAEAFLRRYGGEDFEVHSAGTEVTRVHPIECPSARRHEHRLAPRQIQAGRAVLR